MENENYEGISKIYDMMMLGVDYEGWADYILGVAKSMGATPKTALDLACGTGSTTIPLARRGLKMSGLDLSSPMLQIAEEKSKKAGVSISYHCQNMLSMDFSESFDMVVSFQDGINYLTGEGDFEKLAENVSRILKKGGIFLFDINLVDQYSASETTVVDLDEIYLVYENHYDEDRRIWHIKVTGFLPEGDLYRKFEEIHEEKKHDLKEVESAFCRHGMKIYAVYAMFTQDPPTEHTRRVLVAAQKTVP
ncbi:MAG TPA: class I SAM-dependent methyltransferase [Firmicutes bacterium]|nr:class I SAM-dependent methyltransferase [Bacillota bacterium]